MVTDNRNHASPTHNTPGRRSPGRCRGHGGVARRDASPPSARPNAANRSHATAPRLGGAMAAPDGTYTAYLIPGMLAMTMLFGLESMVVAVTTDAAKGVTERIRAMPVSGVAVLTGRSWADMLNAVAGLLVMVMTGLAVGWRPQHGLAPTLAALGLLLWLRFAFTWVGIYLGLLLKTPESAVAVQVLVWPIGFSPARSSPRRRCPPGWAVSPPGTRCRQPPWPSGTCSAIPHGRRRPGPRITRCCLPHCGPRCSL
ncbi:ABC transporter permease [Micromonospora sp. CPCC 206061]|uniref:ABC transporter permease n=1 Tax=Micromonospora sp. CPCC 206061 TaxID=3122410 RepID=UPI003FA53B85